jgi:hypothetical protein
MKKRKRSKTHIKINIKLMRFLQLVRALDMVIHKLVLTILEILAL